MPSARAVVRAADLRSDRLAVARTALAGIPLAVVVVGAGMGTARSCATGTAMYVSFAPPCLAVALFPGSSTRRLLEAAGAFSVSVLREDQLDVAAAAGRSARGTDKFAALDLSVLESEAVPGVPGLADAMQVIWCRVTDRLETGDHVLFVGEVVAFTSDDVGDDPAHDSRALLRHHRRYLAAGRWLSEAAPEGYPT